LGDQWLYIGLDATTKAVISYILGKRSTENTIRLALDLRARILNRPQITSDGYAPYPRAIEEAFEGDCDFAQLVKEYRAVPGNEAAQRYSPGEVVGIKKDIICGNPDEEKISTSYAERFNLTTRMHMRRYTRLTSGFSRKLSHHLAAVALHIAWYNLCRVHETLRVTPAMALGVTDHIWTLEELIRAALSAPEPMPVAPPTTPKPTPTGMSAARAKGEMRGWDPTRKQRPKLTVIRGGRP
jgi:IS1 family transposase